MDLAITTTAMHAVIASGLTMLLFSYLLFIVSLIFGLAALFSTPIRGWMNTNSDSLTVFFAVVAGAYVLIEYQNQQYEQRLERTRSYIERIESGTVHSSRQWFDLHWIINRDLLIEIDKANYGENANKEKALSLKQKYMADFEETGHDDNEQNIQNLMRLFYFYSDLAKCVELTLCDAKTACNVFSEDIGKFYVLHSDFILKWRKVSFEKNFDTIKAFLNFECNAG